MEMLTFKIKMYTNNKLEIKYLCIKIVWLIARNVWGKMVSFVKTSVESLKYHAQNLVKRMPSGFSWWGTIIHSLGLWNVVLKDCDGKRHSFF